MLDSFGHDCACVIRSTMETEGRLEKILSKDPLAPVHIPDGELSENPGFFLPLHVNYIQPYAELLNLQSTLNRCSRLMLTLPVEKRLANVTINWWKSGDSSKMT
jgi:hypothetical protein